MLLISSLNEINSQARQYSIISHSNQTTCSFDSLDKMQIVLSGILKENSYSKENKRKALSRKIEISKCLFEKNKYAEVVTWLQDINELIGSAESSGFNGEFFELSVIKGKALGTLGSWIEALENYKQALKLSHKNSSVIDEEHKLNIHFEIGKGYMALEDHLLALDYFNKAIAICDGLDFCPIEQQVDMYNYMGECYKFLEKATLSLNHFEKAISLAQKLPPLQKNKKIIVILGKKGRMHNYFDEYEEAIQCFNDGIKLSTQIFGPYSKRTATSIDFLGNSYYYLKNYPKAIEAFDKALQVFKKVDGENSTAVADQYSKIAACYTNLEDFEVADSYMNRCFDVLGFDPKHDHPFESYKASRTHLLIALYFKAKNHQKAYEAGRGAAQLYEASRWFEFCIELIEYINSTFVESGSKQYLLDRFYYVFEAAINCKYHLYQETDSLQYLEQAFGFAERSKALLLKEAMWMADVALELGIPDGLLEEERRLKKAIIELENTRYERQQGQIGNVIHGINSEIFKLKEAYHKVMDSIQQHYPDSYRLQYAAGPITTGQVREELLAPGQALVQYFLGEETIFLFVINREGATLTKLPRGEGLDEAINGFRESIYGWSRFREDSLSRQYADYGYLLYQKLVQPVAHQLPEQLIIIPDGLLEYLPFEALLLEAVNPGALPYNAYPYFLRRHQVSYAHSAELLREMKTARHEADRRWVLAFAPSFNDPPEEEPNLALRRRNLGRLGSNVKEVQAIKRLWRTRIHKGQDATRERFLADAPYYSIIHLATHAKANDEEGEYSFLAFTEIPDTIQNELLYAKDLYSLRLKADMVVLSACETGVGELRRGEGVISLARGFSYAGAKSLATTLWRVSDRESAALMNLFYQQMKEGHPKDKALRNAKLQFISQSGPELAHPFFWAAFVLSGDMAPIEVSGRTFTNWGFAFLIGLFVFLGWRFAKNKPS